MLFRGDHFADLKLKNADKSMIEVTKIIGEMWNDLDEKRKNVLSNISIIGSKLEGRKSQRRV